MTRTQVLQRLGEIGDEIFVDQAIQDDPVAYTERGLAWGLAFGVVASITDHDFRVAMQIVESDLARFIRKSRAERQAAH